MTKDNIKPTNLTIVTAAHRPELEQIQTDMAGISWPEFMLHDPVSRYFTELFEYLPQYQYAITHNESGEVLAVGNCVPIHFADALDELPDTGWDWAIEKGIKDFEANRAHNCLCALQIMIPPDSRGRGLSSHMVLAMMEIARQNRLDTLIAPVRPNRKAEFPETPMEEYVRRLDDDGLPFDPWMRVHARLGAQVIKVCEQSMTIPGTVGEWESWTGRRFKKSGRYVIPGALVPIEVICEDDSGRYIEPNVWMAHSNLLEGRQTG